MARKSIPQLIKEIKTVDLPGKVEQAPNDGNAYVRKDDTWQAQEFFSPATDQGTRAFLAGDGTYKEPIVEVELWKERSNGNKVYNTEFSINNEILNDDTPTLEEQFIVLVGGFEQSEDDVSLSTDEDNIVISFSYDIPSNIPIKLLYKSYRTVYVESEET